MKKILLGVLLTGSFLFGLPACHDGAAHAATVEELQGREQETLSALKHRIAGMSIPQQQDLADFILTKIKSDSNPGKRADYYTKLNQILIIPDDGKRMTALRNFGKNPDSSGTADAPPAADDTKAQEEANLRELQQLCTSAGRSWNSQARSCSGGTTTTTTTPPKGTQGTGSSGSGKGSSGGGSPGGGGSSMGGGGMGSGGGMGGGGSGTSSGSGSSGYNSNAGADAPPAPSKELADGSGTECGYLNAKVTAYGYTGDKTPDSNSNFRCTGGRCASSCKTTGPDGLRGGACGMGIARNNVTKEDAICTDSNGKQRKGSTLLFENRSFAISDDIVKACNLKIGDVICVDIGQGEECGAYEDRSPQKNNVDRYMPNVKASVGNTYFKRAKGLIVKKKKSVPLVCHPGK